MVCPAAGRVVGRERLAGKVLRPELLGDVVHLALDAVGLGLGELQHLVGGEPGVEFEFELLGELLLAEPPLAGGLRQQFLLEPLSGSP